MLLDTRDLFKAGGFEAYMAPPIGGAISAHVKVRAAFVTADNVERARSMASQGTSTIMKVDFRFGDLLVMIPDNLGKASGKRYSPGMDAGLMMSVTDISGNSYLIPVSGRHMTAAHRAISLMRSQGRRIDPDQKTLLNSLTDLFDMVAANPDTDRFSADLIGQAYICKMLEGYGELRLSVSEAEFGRKARAELLRSEIASLRKTHPDAHTQAASLAELLNSAGIFQDPPGQSAIPRYGARRERGMTARDFFRSLQASTQVFSVVTSTDVSTFDTRELKAEEVKHFLEEFADKQLSGQWVERATRVFAQEINSFTGVDAMIAVHYLCIDSLDVVIIQQETGDGLMAGWPAAERYAHMDLGGELYINVSPQEIPDEVAIAQLKLTLNQLQHEVFIEREARREKLASQI